MRTAVLIVVLVSLALAPVTAWAGGVPKVDVSNASVECDTVIGVELMKPAWTLAGTTTPAVIKLNAKLSGCAVTGATVTNLTGSLTGTITLPIANNCIFLTNPIVGGQALVKIAWKSDRTTPLEETSSTIVWDGLLASPLTPFSSGNYITHGSFLNPTVGGAFSGSGLNANVTFAISEDVTHNITPACLFGDGIKKLHIGMGFVTLNL